MLLKTDTTFSFQIFQLSRFGTWLLISFILVKFLSIQQIIAEFEYSLFLLGLASFFWNIGLKNALLNHFSKSPDPEKSIKTTFYLLLLGGFCTALAMGFFAFLSDLELMLQNRSIYMFLFLVFGVSTMPEYILLLRKQTAALRNFGFIIHGILFFLICIAVHYKAGLSSLLMVYGGWLLLKASYAYWLIMKNAAARFSVSEGLAFFNYSLPFMFYIAISNAMEFIDGIIVKQYFPIEDFPIYRYGARELPISLILFSALVTASIPLFIQNGKESLHEVKSRIRNLIMILFPVTAVLILLSPFLFRFFYNELYLESAEIFRIHLLIILSRAWVPQIILISKEYMKQLMFISIIEIIINISFSIYLMNIMGLRGIAYGTLIAYIVHKFILIVYLNLKEKIKPQDYMPIKTYASFSLLLIMIFLISKQLL